MAGRLYLPPSNEDPLLQGDIFHNVPFVWVTERPLLIARHFQQGAGGRQIYGVHKEFDAPTLHPGATTPPTTPFRLEDREDPELAVVPVVLSTGIMLTHDCEIENDDHRLLALIRPITDLEEPFRQRCLDGLRTDMFPLLPQDDEPAMPTSYVDFKIITPLRPRALSGPVVRHASASSWLRKALAGAFWEYLFHKFNEPRAPISAG